MTKISTISNYQSIFIWWLFRSGGKLITRHSSHSQLHRTWKEHHQKARKNPLNIWTGPFSLTSKICSQLSNYEEFIFDHAGSFISGMKIRLFKFISEGHFIPSLDVPMKIQQDQGLSKHQNHQFTSVAFWLFDSSPIRSMHGITYRWMVDFDCTM